MDRSSKPLQELEVFRGLQSLRRSLSSSPSIYTSTIVASMCILKGVKRFQAVRPRACKKPPALDNDQGPSWRDLGVRYGVSIIESMVSSYDLGSCRASPRWPPETPGAFSLRRLTDASRSSLGESKTAIRSDLTHNQSDRHARGSKRCGCSDEGGRRERRREQAPKAPFFVSLDSLESP